MQHFYAWCSANNRNPHNLETIPATHNTVLQGHLRGLKFDPDTDQVVWFIVPYNDIPGVEDIRQELQMMGVPLDQL